MGQEQIKQLEDREQAYADIEAKLAELTKGLQPKQSEPEEMDKQEVEDYVSDEENDEEAD